MTPKNTLEKKQMKLLFCETKPMALPPDKQQQLASALADLLLGGAAKPSGKDEGAQS